MNPSTRRRIQLIAVAGTMILTLGAGPMGLSGIQQRGLDVQWVSVQGNNVAIVVANLSPRTLSGTVVVHTVAGLDGRAASVPVTVAGGGATTVYVEVPGPIEAGVTVGVVLDDGAPF